MRSVWFVVALWLLLGPSSPVRAQDGPDVRSAVDAFEVGTHAADEERWSDALPAFQRAYELTHSDIALFNVGYVLRALGRFVEARDAFNQVILSGDADAELLAQARSYRDEVVGRIAHLRVDGLEVDVPYGLRLDGGELDDDGARPLVVDLDPGRHGLSVRREGYLAFDWSGTLAESASERIEVAMLPIPAGGTVADEPWFWIVIGAVVVGAAIGIGLAVDEVVQLRTRPEATVVRL